MWKVFQDNVKIGTYENLMQVNDIVAHEIYLYNCDIKDSIDRPVPKFKIESDLEK